jgi:RHS repeat-associated protein
MPYLFQGGRYDSTTGLYEFGARDYSPTLGRWMEQDPAGYAAGDSNLYGFLAEDPLDATDPSGLDRLWAFEHPWTVFGEAWSLLFPERSDIGSPVHVNFDPNATGRPGLTAGDIIDSNTRSWANKAVCGLKSQLGESTLDVISNITVTTRGLKHVLDRHFPGGVKSAGKSLFNAGEDISKLVQEAVKKAIPVRQAGGNFEWVVNAGRFIGIDRATGLPTSVYTVITNAAGDLVTAFPGMP